MHATCNIILDKHFFKNLYMILRKSQEPMTLYLFLILIPENFNAWSHIKTRQSLTPGIAI